MWTKFHEDKNGSHIGWFIIMEHDRNGKITNKIDKKIEQESHTYTSHE